MELSEMQARAAEMSDAELSKAAFIQITAKDTLADVNRDLRNTS